MLSAFSTLVIFSAISLHGIVNASNSTINCTDVDWSDVNTTNTTLLSHIFQQCLNMNLPYEECPDPTVCERGEPNSKNIALAFGLTIGAGLATTVGALIPFIPCIRRSDTKYLAAALALAAGVMIHVSYTEIYDESRIYFCCETVEHYDLVTSASFFVGIILTILLDILVRYLEKIDCGCSYPNCKEVCQSRRETHISQCNDTTNHDIAMETVNNQTQATNVSSLQNGGLFHTQRSDQGSLLDTATSDSAFDQRSVPSYNNSPTIPNNNNNINTDLSLPDADSHLERGSISAGSNAISMTTNNLGDASIQDLLSNTSIHRMHTVAESASNNMEALSHVSISLMNENEDGLSLNPSLRTQSYPNGDVNSRISAPSLQRRASYEEMVEQQEETRTEGMEQFRLVTDIVNPDVNKLRRMGLLTGLAIAIHNFPEGLATFVATLSDPSLGGALALAIALHNIPEGICVAMPVYYATGSKLKAFFWAFLSGISEPLGALLGWLILQRLFGPLFYGISFGVIAGMMIYISLKEILPMAHKFDSTKGILVTIFLVIGMFIMAISLVLFAY